MRVLPGVPLAVLLMAMVAMSLAPAFAAPTREEVLAAVGSGKAAGGDFSGAVAPGLALEHQDLSGTLWRDADLRGITLTDVNLSGAVLAGADLRGATLQAVSLADADLTGTDLSGARLRLVNLAGAKLDGCQLNGATVYLSMLSANGGTHSEALRLALNQATGQQFSRAWVDGLSGDVFAFVFNVDDPGFWPGTPFTVNPLTAAPTALGLESKLREDYFAERVLTEGETLAPGIHVVPLRAERTDLWLLRGMPLWSVVEKREMADKRLVFTLEMPPFAQDTMRREMLLKLWEGPWPTLEPVGALKTTAKSPLLTITGAKVTVTSQAQLAAALRQAAAIMGEKRTYGPLVPGAAGLARLAGELRQVGESGDIDRAKRLAIWEQFPRECLLGSRNEACQFLEEGLKVASAGQQAILNEALVLLRSEVTVLKGDWPGLAPEAPTMSPELRAQYTKAAEIVGTAASVEGRLAQLLAEAATTK